MKMKLLLALVALAVGLIASPLSANPRVSVVSDWAISDNMTALGFSPRIVPIDNNVPGQGSFNSDLAFWGDTVVQGDYAGFRLVDVTYPTRPKQIVNWEQCQSNLNSNGNQGDVLVWGNLVMRSWNSPDAGADQPGHRDGVPDHRPAALHDAGRVLRRLAHVPRAGQPGPRASGARPGGRAHHRHQRPEEPGRDRVRRHAVRLAHRDARAGSRQQPAARLLERVGQHDLRAADRADRAAELPRHRHPPGPAGQPGRGVVPSLRGLRRPGRAGRRSPRLPRHAQ